MNYKISLLASILATTVMSPVVASEDVAAPAGTKDAVVKAAVQCKDAFVESAAKLAVVAKKQASKVADASGTKVSELAGMAKEQVCNVAGSTKTYAVDSLNGASKFVTSNASSGVDAVQRWGNETINRVKDTPSGEQLKWIGIGVAAVAGTYVAVRYIAWPAFKKIAARMKKNPSVRVA